jgi:hypothetical protein
MNVFLIGYSTGGGTAPLFMEPVFSDGSENFLQTCESDQIVDFINYEEEVDILELGSESEYSVGSRKVFAVLDTGGRVISGDRNYVTRYLKQNKDRYIDTPYFYVSVLEFCDIESPELLFINHRSELLEATALSNSIRRYCQSERERLVNSEKSVPSDSIVYWLTQPTSDSLNTWSCVHSLSGKDKSFVRLWLDFASTDAPRLMHRSKWKDIEKVYKELSFDDDKRQNRYMWCVASAAEDCLQEIETSKTELESSISKSTSLARGKSLHISIGPSVDSISRYSDLVNRVCKRRVNEKLKSKEVSKFEVSMAVFFFKLSFKIYREEIVENEDARNKINQLTLNTLHKLEIDENGGS